MDLRGNSKNTAAGAAELAQLVNLNQLKVHRIKIDDATVAKMFTPTVSQAIIYDCSGVSGQFISQYSSGQLTYLQLTGTEFQPSVLQHISKLTRIETLIVDGPILQSDFVAELAKLPALKRVTDRLIAFAMQDPLRQPFKLDINLPQ